MCDNTVWTVFFMIKRLGLKKWELALLIALSFTLLFSFFRGGTECFAWWGTVYPELTDTDGAYAAAAVTEGRAVILRSRIAEYIAALLARFR